MQSNERLGPIAAVVEEAVADLVARDAPARLWAGDHTLWSDDPTEIGDRLGWAMVWQEARDAVPGLLAAADAATADGLERAVVCGMGGSSLFPEVLDRTFGSRPDRLDLTVLDSTDPSAVAGIEDEWDLRTTLFVVSSKSGSTIETRSHLEHFWRRIGEGRQFAVVTDPGSELAGLAAERGFRAVFENRPDIGGRYSALSLFGLVPGAYAGVPLDGLLDGAATTAAACGGPGGLPGSAADPALRLGAVMGAGARAGRDKLTFVVDPRYAAFDDWVEQLIAESTGKHGRGVLPVVSEPLGTPDDYGADRLFVVVGDVTDDDRALLDDLAVAGHPVVEVPNPVPPVDDALDHGVIAEALGAQVLLWELATAHCGAVLGINPFDQPDVAAAKAATAEVLEQVAAGQGLPDEPLTPLDEVLALVGPGDYLSIQAYVDPTGDVPGRLQEARLALRDRLKVATTVGIGPRFLHSTGQLHKGGPPTGVFVQVVGDDPDDVPVPGRDFGFSVLKQAQAAGDLRTLRDRGLRAARVSLDELLAAAGEGW